MASSSSSHRGNVSVIQDSGERRNVEQSVKVFDVFINHRGPDVKKTLVLELYESLEKLGIHAFLDYEETELGTSFPDAIKTAISSAKVHIAIFSRRYAESPWCLEELLLMLESEAKIIPVFYEVEPWELRHIEKGVYDKAFKQYQEKSRYIDKLDGWKQALNKISTVKGHEIKKSKCPFGFRRATPDCKELAGEVQGIIQKMKVKLYVAKYPVGLPMLVEDLERKCGIGEGGQGKARIVGICGMRGAGKTTLSKELFNKYSSKYTRACFLSAVRDASNKNALYSLQQKLLKDLFAEDNPCFSDTGEGLSHLKDRLNRIMDVNFLIVLDDIDHVEQLENLLVTDMKKKSGDSLIIITTRDTGVLRQAGIPTVYRLEGLNEDDARSLFCFHAFDKGTPDEEYESLVEDFVQACGRLPLSLQILGSHVKGGDLEYWSSELSKVRQAQLHKDIKETLKISIDPLDPQTKEIFMDIACFFIGYSKNVAKRVWEASGWVAHQALERLKEKFIVQEIEAKLLDGRKWEWDGIELGMHDHLRDLGREMANQQTIRRLWKPRDLKNLGSIEGFRKILGETKNRCFHSFFDTSTGSQITYFLAESDGWGETSASLLWLQLDLKSFLGPSIPSIFSWVPVENLHCLRICNGQLEKLWESHLQAPLQLKELQICETFLKEVPDLGKLKDLVNIVLDAKYMAEKGFSLLESLGMNVSTLCLMSSTLEGKLACNSNFVLIIRNFDISEEMVLNWPSPISSVEILEIGNQNLGTKFLITGTHFQHLKSLKLHHIKNLIEMDLLRVETLNSLQINHCKNLQRVSQISDLTNLVELNISECPELESELCLSSLYCLQKTTVDKCRKLKCLELFDCKMLAELNISDCPELMIEVCLSNRSSLKTIRVERCRKLKVKICNSVRNGRS